MKKDKISIALIAFSGFISSMAMAETTNRDVATEVTNKNTSSQSVQAVVNSEINAKLPNTDQSKALNPSVASRNAQNSDTTTWGESPSSPFVKYDANIDNKTVSNCKDIVDGKCSVKTETHTLQTENQVKTSTSVNLDSSGFLTAQPAVLTSQGSGAEGKYFYRYWNTNSAECDDGLGACWSPSFPVICLGNKNVSTLSTQSAEKARDYFGKRDQRKIGDDPKKPGVNSYTVAPGSIQYQMLVGVEPDRVYGDISGNYFDGSESSLTVQKWTANGACLEPDFNSGKVVGTEILKNAESLQSVTGAVDSKDEDGILPCGMFSKSRSSLNSAKYNTLTGGFDCNPSNVFVKKDNLGANYYTRYKLYLPVLGSGATGTAQNNGGVKFLNVRECGKCEAANSRCPDIVRGALMNAGCQLSGLRYNCSNAQLDSAVRSLRVDSSFKLYGTEGEEIGSYSQCLTCNTCLNTLETTLKTLLVVNN